MRNAQALEWVEKRTEALHVCLWSVCVCVCVSVCHSVCDSVCDSVRWKERWQTGRAGWWQLALLLLLGTCHQLLMAWVSFFVLGLFAENVLSDL